VVLFARHEAKRLLANAILYMLALSPIGKQHYDSMAKLGGVLSIIGKQYIG